MTTAQRQMFLKSIASVTMLELLTDEEYEQILQILYQATNRSVIQEVERVMQQREEVRA